MMKRRLFMFLILALVFAMCLQNVLAVSSTAETKPYIVEETYIPIEDHTFDNKGWLGMRALPPIGFCGVVCVDVKNTTTGETQTVELKYIDMYMDGLWLDAGNYSIERAYLASGDHFLVESETENVQIEPGKKLNIEFVIRENPDAAEPIQQEHGKFKPKPPREPIPGLTQESQQQTEPENETPTEIMVSETASAQTVETEVHTENTGKAMEKSSNIAITLLVAAAFMGVVFLGIWFIKGKHKNS